MSEPNDASKHPQEAPQLKPLQSALHKLNEEKPQVLHEMMMAMGVGPVTNPLHQKMTPEHITQVLTLAAAHDQRQFELAKQGSTDESTHKISTRRYFFWCFAIVMGVVLVILFLFQEKPNILLPALTGLGGFLTGAAAGFGVGKQQKS